MYKDILNEILLSRKPSASIYKLIESGEIKSIIPEITELQGFDQKPPTMTRMYWTTQWPFWMR